MTGYLQRIAATAAGPQPALHPLVGSIFRQTSRDAGADPPPQIEEIAGSEEFGQSATRTDGSEFPADRPRRGEPAAEDGLEEPPAAARPIEDQRFQPLMPPSPVTARFPVIADQSAGREAAASERASAGAAQQQPPATNFPASAAPGVRLAAIPIRRGGAARPRPNHRRCRGCGRCRPAKRDRPEIACRRRSPRDLPRRSARPTISRSISAVSRSSPCRRRRPAGRPRRRARRSASTII